MALIVLLVYPYSDDPLAPTGLPRGAVPVYIDLTPQAGTETGPTTPAPVTSGAPTTTNIIRLSDAQLADLARQYLPASRVRVRSQLGRLLVSGGTADSIQADAWLVAEEGRLRLRLRSLVWRGFPVPPPLLGFLADQISNELQDLFPQAEVAVVEAQPGELSVIVRPLSR